MIYKSEKEVMKYWESKGTGLPLLSIICFAYNHDKYITRTLDGFLMQKTDFSFEIIVHDDASTDHTPGIIRRYEKRFPNIVYPVYEKENQYSKRDGSLYRALKGKVRGKYVAYCEGDDYWIKDEKLQKQVDFLEANPSYTCTYHPVYYVKDGMTAGHDILSYFDRDVTAEEIIAGGGEFCASPSMCFRSEYLYQKWKFKDISDVGDYPMQIILGLNGKVRYMSMIAACYRIETDRSWSSRMSLDRKLQARHNKTEIKSMLELNKETKGRYEKSIFYHIGVCYLTLWDLGFVGRHYFLRAAKKSGTIYGKRLLKFYHRRIIKNKFKRLYQLYFHVRYEFLSAVRMRIFSNTY